MKKSNPNLCELKGCYNESYVKYYGVMICQSHFERHCEHPFLKRVLNIPETIKNAPEPNKTNLKGYI
jgi:hypothetical protein